MGELWISNIFFSKPFLDFQIFSFNFDFVIRQDRNGFSKVFLIEKYRKMTKSLTIEFDPKDEFFLLALFQKMKVRVSKNGGQELVHEQVIDSSNAFADSEKEEILFVQNALREKYVTSGEWEKLTEDEKEDSALAEMMNYERQRDDYKIMTVEDSQAFYATLKKQLYADKNDWTFRKIALKVA